MECRCPFCGKTALMDIVKAARLARGGSKIGRSVRYLREDLDEWLEQLKQKAAKAGIAIPAKSLTI